MSTAAKNWRPRRRRNSWVALSFRRPAAQLKRLTIPRNPRSHYRPASGPKYVCYSECSGCVIATHFPSKGSNGTIHDVIVLRSLQPPTPERSIKEAPDAYHAGASPQTIVVSSSVAPPIPPIKARHERGPALSPWRGLTCPTCSLDACVHRRRLSQCPMAQATCDHTLVASVKVCYSVDAHRSGRAT